MLSSPAIYSKIIQTQWQGQRSLNQTNVDYEAMAIADTEEVVKNIASISVPRHQALPRGKANLGQSQVDGAAAQT
jgi:hypothetical protein